MLGSSPNDWITINIEGDGKSIFVLLGVDFSDFLAVGDVGLVRVRLFENALDDGFRFLPT